MPQLYSFGKYVIYFWVNEGMPLEPVHVHHKHEKRPSRNGTKIWITSQGKTLICHNKSQIPERLLNQLCRFIEANSQEIMEAWNNEFREARFYC